MSSVGYGDITPKNTFERVFGIIIMIVASGIYALIIEQISHVVNNFNLAAV